MVDIVTNHMGYNGCGNCVDYSRFKPFNSLSYFHQYCAIDFSNEYSPTLQTCWQGDNTVSLPDLRTEDAAVRAIWKDWIAQIVSKYNIDGLRIDSAKHIEKDFHRFFEDAAGVYTIGEVLNGDPAYALDYQRHMSGIFNYPLFFWMKRAFGTDRGAGFGELANGITTVKDGAANTSYLGTISENHDQERWPRITSDTALIRNVIALTLMADGIPVVYQGQEHYYRGDALEGRAAIWFSQYGTQGEAYGMIARLNAARRHALLAGGGGFAAYEAWPIYVGDGTMALRKGFDGAQLVSVYSNRGAGSAQYSVALGTAGTGFGAGQRVVDVLSCGAATTGGNGDLSVVISGGIPRVYALASMLAGSGLCGL
jgi:alpha-amylase